MVTRKKKPITKTARKKSTKQTKKEQTSKIKLAKVKKAKAPRKKKAIYFFGGGKAEGSGKMNELLGGKGAGLAEMTNAGVPVPPGFTITTEACTLFYKNNLQLPKAIDQEMFQCLSRMEKITHTRFGDPKAPLLLSVRSGSKFSMPGMMDTVLNLGLNEETLKGLVEKTKDERFAYDSYRRLIQMFGSVVMGVDREAFDKVISRRKERERIKLDAALSVEDLKYIIAKFKELIKKKTGEYFPGDPKEQLRMARDAVFKSWNNPRAISYRRLHGIPGDLGTAVNIQAMVFGNMGENSATGVGFTRNPSTGAREFYGEYLTNAQGEDVVSGVRTPKHISELEKEMPTVYRRLERIAEKLEKHYRDLQDYEFTIQQDKLYMLQTRTGKRTAHAAVKIAVDMAKERLLTKREALSRVEPGQLNQLLHRRIDPSASVEVVAKGLAASPGAASGMVVFTADDAVRYAQDGESVILVRKETNPDDIEGINVASGILTARGGMTSHAAVVARGMGKSCVAGCEAIKVFEHQKHFIVKDHVVREGDIVTLNGSTGEVMLGEVPTIEPELTGEFGEFISWADEFANLKVRANADMGKDARVARKYGAEGIGLCRTEHMFFAEERLPIVQDMILAEDQQKRAEALQKLLPLQKKDFIELFNEMRGYPVTIRTIDPPLHEFLPNLEDLMVEIAILRAKKESFEEIEAKGALFNRVKELHEFNPMLGQRGCRVGIMYPEITEMQTRAIMEAACAVAKTGQPVMPEIMIPLVGHVNEFRHQKEIIKRVAEEVMQEQRLQIEYLVGTMIEVPRGALTADEIAREADFFSFGTNDLTQMVFGFSRDDCGKFLNYYLDKGIMAKDPYTSIDLPGVGQLMRIAVQKARSVKPHLKIGICGEHAGDPASIHLCHQLGLDYVSCSPFRVPIARLAAAQAAVGKSEYTSM
jgi:pyruvate,orthophosphate dikinase